MDTTQTEPRTYSQLFDLLNCQVTLGSEWMMNGWTHGKIVELINRDPFNPPSLVIDFGEHGEWWLDADQVSLPGEPRRVFSTLMVTGKFGERVYTMEDVFVELVDNSNPF